MRVVSLLVVAALCAVGLAPAATGVATAANPGPVAWWALDDTSEAVTDAVGDASGVVVGGQWVQGRSGGAFAAATDGDGIRVGDQAVLNPETLSVDVWVMGVGIHRTGENLFGKGWVGCGLNSYALSVGDSGGVRFSVSDGVGTVYSAESAAIWDGLWHHVAGSFDGQVLRLYVDGVAVGTGAEVGAIGPRFDLPDSSLWMAGAPPAAAECPSTPQFVGSLDSPRLWDRALSPTEITALSADGRVATTTTLAVPPEMQVGVPTTVAAAVDPAPIGGIVEFVDIGSGEQVLASAVPDENGVAMVDIRLVLLGVHDLQARYAGSPTFAPSVSNTASTASVKNPVAPGEARLGTNALNGPIRALVTDPATGITYAGGDFTRVGPRTGPVALISGPDAADATVDAASPEIVGTVNNAIADGAGGAVIVGELVAVNGTPVPLANGYPTPMIRMRGDGTVDADWVASTKGLACTGLGGVDGFGSVQLYRVGPWLVGAAPRAGITTTEATSTTGLMFVKPDTGDIFLSGQGSKKAPDGSACPRIWSSIPPLPQMIGCSWCYAAPSYMAYDEVSDVLVVGYTFMRNVNSAWKNSLVLVAYDVSAGTRLWSREVSETGGAGAHLSGAASLGGRVILFGSFPLEASPAPTWDTVTTALVIDPSSGSVIERWTTKGKVSLADPLGPTIPAAVPWDCNPGRVQPITAGLPSPDGPTALVGTGTMSDTGTAATASICRWTLDGSSPLAAEKLGSMDVPWGQNYIADAPNWVFTAGERRYLVSPFGAFDLAAGQVTTWNPDPSLWYPRGGFVQVGEKLLIHGPFTFLGGRSAEHVIAFDATMEPVEAFGAQVSGPVQALALWRGRLVLGGTFAQVNGTPRTELAAVDARTGVLDPWTPDETGRTHPGNVQSLSVDPASQHLYVGGVSCIDDWHCRGADSPSVVRYADIAVSGAADPDWTPTLTCITPKTSDTHLTRCPDVTVSLVRAIDGDVYIGGDFTKVNGVARQGLARLDEDSGALDTWSPDLFAQMGIPSNAELFSIKPRELMIRAGRVHIAGEFAYWIPYGGGAGQVVERSPLVVFDKATEARIYPPASGSLVANFPVAPDQGGFSVGFYGPAVVVALGRQGAAVLDAATFKYDPTANPYLSKKWWAETEGIFALAGEASTPVVAANAVVGERQLQILAQLEPLVSTNGVAVLGGAIPRWGNRTAGNLVEAGVPIPDVAPPVARVPGVSPALNSSIGSTTARVRVSWASALETGSGVKAYTLQWSRDGGTWKTVSLSSPTATAVNVTEAYGHSYRFRLRATDKAGNVGSWVTSPSHKPALVQQSSTSVRYGGTWRTSSLSGASGGSVKYAVRTGSSARFTFTGRAVAWVTTLSATRGTAVVYVDGRKIATISCRSGSTVTRRTIFSATLPTGGTHVLTIKTTSSRRVDVDAFVVLK